jgi:hypothetical protein
MKKARKLAGTAAVTALAGGFLGVLGAGPAQAWTWSSTVTVHGTDGCSGFQSGTVYGYGSANGESHIATSGPGFGSYSMTFGSIPSGGELITFQVYCSMSGNNSVTAWVSRPTIGTSKGLNI